MSEALLRPTAKPPRRMREWQGAYVRCRVSLANRVAATAAGGLYRIRFATSMTFWLTSAPCPACRIQLEYSIKGARRRAVLEFLGFKPPAEWNAGSVAEPAGAKG